VAVVAVALGATLLLGACAARRRVGNGGGGNGTGVAATDPLRRGDPTAAFDPSRIYAAMGLIAAPEPIPFVASVSFLAGSTPDTTLAVVTLSLPNRALTFAREGERYRAAYEARLDVKQGLQTARHVEAPQVVRVATFKETTRDDESIIFQQILSLAPGQYGLDIAVRDAGSARSATAGSILSVPRLGPGAVSTPIAVFEATPRTRTDSLPSLVTSPRATAAFGRDSVIPIYLEAYGAPPSAVADGGGDVARVPVTLTVRSDRGGTLWSDTATLPRRSTTTPAAAANRASLYSGVVNVPVSRVGVGVASLVARRTAVGPGAGGASDSARTPIFVSFGDELPVTTFEEMLSYLRFFTTPERIRALRDTAPEHRAAAWAAFLHETDPNSGTPQNEAIRDYFTRIRQANARFRDEGGAGWLSDRGMVYVTLGDPDQVYEQAANDVSQRGRAQIWEYREYNAQLIFVDQTGFGRWRLTSSSAAEFASLARRLQTRRAS
jgi:GWxTD domain-containing protein